MKTGSFSTSMDLMLSIPTQLGFGILFKNIPNSITTEFKVMQ
jgi:hypothetical protein